MLLGRNFGRATEQLGRPKAGLLLHGVQEVEVDLDLPQPLLECFDQGFHLGLHKARAHELNAVAQAPRCIRAV